MSGDGAPPPEGPDRGGRPRVPPPPPDGSRGTSRRVLEIVQLTVLVLLTTGTGLAVASQLALPGDMLYPVKLRTEAVILALNPGDDAELEIDFARRRVTEARQRPEYASEILSRAWETAADPTTRESPEAVQLTREASEATQELLGGELPAGTSERAQAAYEDSRSAEGSEEGTSPPTSGGDGTQPPSGGAGTPPDDADSSTGGDDSPARGRPPPADDRRPGAGDGGGKSGEERGPSRQPPGEGRTPPGQGGTPPGQGGTPTPTPTPTPDGTESPDDGTDGPSGQEQDGNSEPGDGPSTQEDGTPEPEDSPSTREDATPDPDDDAPVGDDGVT